MSHTSDNYRCCKNPGLSVSYREPAPKRKNVSFLHTSTHTRTLQLNPSSTVLLEKLAAPQLIKPPSAFYGKRRYISVHNSPPHVCIMSQTNLVHAPHQISLIPILILFSNLRQAFQVVSLPQVSKQNPYMRPSLPGRTILLPLITLTALHIIQLLSPLLPRTS
jgi:hypothetical protein